MGKNKKLNLSAHRKNMRRAQLRRNSRPKTDDMDVSNVSFDALQPEEEFSELEPLDIEQASCSTFVGSASTKSPIILEGRRLIDIDFLFKQLAKLSKHSPFDCTFGDMDLMQETRKGFSSQFVFKCRMCNIEKKIETIEEAKDIANNINSSFALATISTEIGYSTAEELFTVLNVPFMSRTTYQRHCDAVAAKIEETAWASMEEAGKEECELARNSGQIDSDGIPMITVVADGAWSKRSYSVNYDALSGVACIIGARTGKLLFLGVRNKYCCICAHAEAKNITPKPVHKCYKNWQGTSTSMESDIICEGFRLSVNTHGLKYFQLVGDGDSSVYKKLIETRPYGNLLVQKIECKNHLLRNFSSKLREVCDRKRSNSKNMSVPPNLRKIVENNSGRIRTCIKSALNFRRQEDVPMSTKVENLCHDLRNVISHVFGEHKNCDKLAYFRCSQRGNEKNIVPFMKECGIYDDIQICMNRLIFNASSLITNMDTNVAEHYNSIVCKFVGGKRINFSSKGSYEARCRAAAISFNAEGNYYGVMTNAFKRKSPPLRTKNLIKRTIRRRENKRRCVKGRILKKKKNTSLPDEDYGPQAVPEPDLVEEILEDKKTAFLEGLKKNEAEIKDLEIRTRGQGNNALWKQERLSRLTASNFGVICKLRKSTSCVNIIRSLLYSPFFGNESTRYGIEHEPIALRAFEKRFNREVKSCGLFVDTQHYIFAASPDGLVGEDSIIEVKCPKNASKLDPVEAIRSKTIKFADLDENNCLILKRNHNYFYQVQGQLHITKKSFCYFVVWSPCGMLVEMIAKDDKFWEEQMVRKLQNFYFECLLPELVDPRFPRKLPIRNPPRNY